ncbi:MAG: MBL fold metallo-hydrolase [Acidobacteria bacterium]|nr:MBL fold metallo-hydrolase [Acidobacteriota bacterium]
MHYLAVIALCLMAAVAPPAGETGFQQDVFDTSAGPLAITFIGHGSLMLKFEGKVIHVDPFSRLTDYSRLPTANLILLTHHHGDHLDEAALRYVRTENSRLVLTAACAEKVTGGMVMQNGDERTVDGIHIEAVPAYNIVHRRDNGEPYHPKGVGNGYICTFGDVRVYIAGDTENIPEMGGLANINIAFLPMNVPYTMTPEMAADAARKVRPRILYPYHYSQTDPLKLVDLLQDEPDIEVRIRSMQ